MVDYLNWRGDIPFSQSPMNEIDSLAMANLSYVPFDTIVPSPWEETGISLREASARFWAAYEDRELLRRISLIKMAPFAMRRMAETERFGGLELRYYQNSVNAGEESQFSALCIRMSENRYYIAFRGTDDTMIGWKENFRMSYETVPAQRKAVEYLNYVGAKCPGELWLGGHSKGGNLAVYGAAGARPAIQERIRGIYNFDGPGFSRAVLQSSRYQAVANRIRKYVPTASVIGMLLEQDENYQVVSSGEQGMRQHDPVSWRVLGTQLVTMPKTQSEGLRINRGVHDWIYSLSPAERKTLVDLLFQAMTEAEIRTLNDLGGRRWRNMLGKLRKRIRENADYQRLTKKAGRRMLEELHRALTGAVRNG